MSFRFEAPAGAPSWTRERYQLFLNAISESHPRTEAMIQQAIQVQTKEGAKPRIKQIVEQVVAMRALTEDGLRAVHLKADELVSNYLRGDRDVYPGFSMLLDEAMAHVRRYAECYHPSGVLEAALHYVDMIDLPVPENAVLRTEEYLNLDFRVPEETFGNFQSFEISAVVRHPNEQEVIHLVFATTSVVFGKPFRRFRLEWHTPVRTGNRMSEGEVKINLQAAHDRLEKCFRHAFTPKGWALFEPEEP
jgi:uncharacterized protein (TIGR04255 family)